jgi:hypothetical protein
MTRERRNDLRVCKIAKVWGFGEEYCENTCMNEIELLQLIIDNSKQIAHLNMGIMRNAKLQHIKSRHVPEASDQAH